MPLMDKKRVICRDSSRSPKEYINPKKHYAIMNPMFL